jgi:hypothetical protein
MGTVTTVDCILSADAFIVNINFLLLPIPAGVIKLTTETTA